MVSVSLLPSKKNDVVKRPTARAIGPLATLPLFFKLEGSKVLVAGGTKAAAWKAELLVAAGAQVQLYAESLSVEFQTLMNNDALLGHIHWHRHNWTSLAFKDAVVAVADIENDDEVQAFCSAGRASGVPVNVIDKPQHCVFRFGSIVNRSPVVIGISSDGSSPILAQAIRRRIETLIPLSLSDWARIAQDLRGQVSRHLQPKQQRRMFWERFSDLAFTSVPGVGAAGKLFADCRQQVSGIPPQSGHVSLVGAGPGDAEFLTLKAVRALQAADIILYDDLVSDEVLELARREAKRMLVGKRGGRKSCRQEDINAMMVKLAKAGKNVVRLKSGDPMVFGRAGEEITCLQDEGIAISTIPGITAAAAMAASLGVSLTHRDHARSVRFVTGHCRKGTLPDDLDWRAITHPLATTIFYMGRSTADQIAETLVAKGLDPSTPVVACAALSRPSEKIWHGSLGDLGAGVRALDQNEPILIGVGAVFGLGQKLGHAESPNTENASSGQL